MEKSKEIISQALSKLEKNQDLELKTSKEKVIEYLDKELKNTLKTMENKQLLTKIGTIQDKIPSLVKNKTNTHQNYKYFEEHEILRILKPLLKENKLTMLITDDDNQPQQYEREGNKHFLRYLKQMEISDRETGESRTWKFWAAGDNTDLAKAKGSAETYAIKYMLSKFFQIRVMDKNEPDLKGGEDNKPTIKAVNPIEAEKKKIMEKVILKADGWYYCKNCDETTEKEPFKLIEKHPNTKLSELKEALKNHGELA